jgi:hypothetical protein
MLVKLRSSKDKAVFLNEAMNMWGYSFSVKELSTAYYFPTTLICKLCFCHSATSFIILTVKFFGVVAPPPLIFSAHFF